MNNKNMFDGVFKTAGRSLEFLNHFLDKNVEITLRDERKIKGMLNMFSENFVFLSGKHIINIRYVVNISIVD